MRTRLKTFVSFIYIVPFICIPVKQFYNFFLFNVYLVLYIYIHLIFYAKKNSSNSHMFSDN